MLAIVSVSLCTMAGCNKSSPPLGSPVSPSHASTPAADSRESATSTDPAATSFRFVDVARELGVDRVTWGGRPGKDHLLDSAGTGAAWLDYDRDGRLDLYVVNCWRMEGSEIIERGRNALYRQDETGHFEDVTDRARVAGEEAWGAGAFAADYDDDGWTDLLVTTFGSNILYRNLGDGGFENVAAKAGVEAPGWNTGAAFLDADRDGDLDLFIAGYIDATVADILAARPTLDWKGVEKVAAGPFGMTGAKDHFFRAEGGGRFVEATEEAGMEDRALGFGFTVRAADFDADGDVDVYLANDSDPNYLYRNEGNGHFKEIAVWAGCALSASGMAQAGMGVAVGDADGDAVLDIVVTNFSEDYTTFYRGLGDAFFEDATARVRIDSITYKPLSWGTALADLDNDGDLDLVIANGHIYPQIDRHPEFVGTYAQRNLILENREGRFMDVTARAGPGFELVHSSRGLAVADWDDDGDLDLAITNLDAPPTLLRNDGRCGHWLKVACETPPGKGPLLGTRVTATVRGRRILRDIAAGDSYMSTHDPRCHFGLGDAEEAERVEVLWLDGTETVIEHVRANQILRVKKT